MINHPNRSKRKNSELLAAPNNALLSGLDKQRRFILQRHSVQMPCPNCGTKQNVFEATGVAIDDYDTDAGGEKIGTCIGCKRGLEHVIPFVVAAGPGWQWSLVKIEPGSAA